jgi:hypothetical protein
MNRAAIHNLAFAVYIIAALTLDALIFGVAQ